MSRLPMLVWILVIVTAIIILPLIYIYFSQDRLVFYPVRELIITPAQLDIEYEDVYIEVGESDKIHGWYIPSGEDLSPTVLFLHGNGGNISHRIETIEFLRELKANQLIIDYRGYGLSDGKPSEQYNYDDARAAYDWLTNNRKVKPESIVIFGRSLGGSIAIDLAAKADCAGLIVESSFTSAKAMSKLIYPFLPLSWLLKYDYNSLKKISTVKCPILITHSESDEMIPYQMGRQLFEAAVSEKDFVKISGGHNERGYFMMPGYRRAVGKLLDRARAAGDK